MRMLLMVIGAVLPILLLMRGIGQRETKAVATMGSDKALASAPRETGRDGRFIAYDNGTVMDTRTSLMWAARDNGRNINWRDAKDYCDNYRGGGYTGWRMPTRDELERLYDMITVRVIRQQKLITRCI